MEPERKVLGAIAYLLGGSVLWLHIWILLTGLFWFVQIWLKTVQTDRGSRLLEVCKKGTIFNHRKLKHQQMSE